MTNSRDTEEHPSLLTYRMPTWQQALLMVARLAIVSVVVYAYFMLRPSFSQFERGLFVSVAVVLAVMWALLISHEVVALSGGHNELIMKLALGRVKRVPWADVLALQRSRLGSVILRLRGRESVWMRMPSKTARMFIAILRETTNARITGFD